MTHPIQYNAPWLGLLAGRERIGIKVFYTWHKNENEKKFDNGFGRTISWDIPLLSGYDYKFVENVSKTRDKGGFFSIWNPALIAEVKSYNPDAVLINGWNFRSHLSAIKYFHGNIPVLFRGDSTLLDNIGMIRRIRRKAILKAVYKNIDFALYVGTENKRYFKEHGIKEENLAFTPHAVDNERFAPTVENAQIANTFRKQLGIDKDEQIFLFAGKFQSKKGVSLLINAFGKLKLIGVHLILVGNGTLEQELKSRASGCNSIHFMNFQNQEVMPAIYQLADVFVLPSNGPGETWGLSVNEAMASGKAVLVSDKCGCATDLVIDGETGFIFKSQDENDLIKKIKLLAKDKALCTIMGENALQKIQEWSFENLVGAIEYLVINRCS